MADYQQKYFDEKFENINEKLIDLLDIAKEGVRANKRLDAIENKFWGIAIGSGLGGGGIVAIIQHMFPR